MVSNESHPASELLKLPTHSGPPCQAVYFAEGLFQSREHVGCEPSSGLFPKNVSLLAQSEQIPQTGRLTVDIYYLTVLEARSPRSTCLRGVSSDASLLGL